jgi:hypothetical protein
MGAGMLFTRHRHALARAFRTTADYMPRAEASDPYLSSAQWSRRLIGLKVFMSLAAAGQDGYATQIEHDCVLAPPVTCLPGRWTVVRTRDREALSGRARLDRSVAQRKTPARMGLGRSLAEGGQTCLEG